MSNPRTGFNTLQEYTKRIRIVRNEDTREEIIKKDKSRNGLPNSFETSESGTSGPIHCDYAVAWTMLFIQGDTDGGTVKFQISPNPEGPFFDYPGESLPSGYPEEGVTDEGVYIFDRLLGNCFGRIIWTGCGENANFFASVTNQMV